ncbi:toprim domain-containing protein [Flavobacteriaceae bacterium F89]|uniref:Toprim domain-containing protein n=1 Tax=Cerina litoralis TaxID=2874477 RepID=A0AAE3JQ59_9FLAO|nr:toprim domain-containing protein [Cerina litoralis]MCG2462810.1 toprim domain-containing protein [Cerina litoralis]
MKKERTHRLSCERARAFPIERALAKLGHFPARTTDKEAWYLSPFRPEAQASFKVSKRLNRWYDHGAGIGGNVIDLVIRLKDCTVQEALDFLKDLPTSFSFQQQLFKKPENTDHIEIVKVQALHHFGAIDYLASRGIRLGTARTVCREVTYTFKGRHYFAIGILNNSRGWELRNKYFKNSSSPKDLTYIKNGNHKLIVTEGMFDLLSIMETDKGLQEEYDLLVLNSTALVKRAMGYLDGYTRIELYLDNDDSGKRTAKTLMENNKDCIDRSGLYKGFKDINEWIVSGGPKII